MRPSNRPASPGELNSRQCFPSTRPIARKCDARRPCSRQASLALAVLAALYGGNAFAADVVCVDAATGQPLTAQQAQVAAAAGNQVACGDGAVAESADAIAIGTNAVSGRIEATYAGAAASIPPNTIAIGTDSQASGGESIAIGRGAKTYQGIGQTANLPTNYGIAIGSGATAIGNNMVIGVDAGAGTGPRNINNITLGNGAGTNVTGNDTVIIGREAAIGSTGGGGSVFIGRTAGQNSANTTNIAVGADAGRNVQTGGQTAVGGSAGNNVRILSADV